MKRTRWGGIADGRFRGSGFFRVDEHNGVFWLVDPDQYERNGRILRDSTSPRLIAYTPGTKTLYVTDGCNSCSHAIEAEPGELTADQLQDLASKTGIRLELLRELSAHRF